MYESMKLLLNSIKIAEISKNGETSRQESVDQLSTNRRTDPTVLIKDLERKEKKIINKKVDLTQYRQ
jgi:hypothetical protein